jgi:hypothetical protein
MKYISTSLFILLLFSGCISLCNTSVLEEQIKSSVSNIDKDAKLIFQDSKIIIRNKTTEKNKIGKTLLGKMVEYKEYVPNDNGFVIRIVITNIIMASGYPLSSQPQKEGLPSFRKKDDSSIKVYKSSNYCTKNDTNRIIAWDAYFGKDADVEMLKSICESVNNILSKDETVVAYLKKVEADKDKRHAEHFKERRKRRVNRLKNQ